MHTHAHTRARRTRLKRTVAILHLDLVLAARQISVDRIPVAQPPAFLCTSTRSVDAGRMADACLFVCLLVRDFVCACGVP